MVSFAVMTTLDVALGKSNCRSPAAYASRKAETRVRHADEHRIEFIEFMFRASQETILRSTMSAIRSRAPIFAPLLVLTLLICHGALGNMDEFALDAAPSVAMHQLQGETGEPGPAEGSPAEHPPAHGYYIVTLLTVAAGAFFWLLSKSTFTTQLVTLAKRQIRHDFALAASLPLPGPTPVLLQVFRL
jgi:hypothetical protein